MKKISYSHEELVSGDVKFGIPQQCAFRDMIGSDWFGGIAYQNYVICGHCGGRVNFEDIEHLNIYSEWINISDEIMGE